MREQRTPAELLVGLERADDAAVYLVAPDAAIVETLDFFPPIVDDAYASGAIAAANAMSDVYAMGGEVLFALQIAAWPEDAPIAQLERVFAGAVDTVREAGGVVAGGHTVIDREPKFGLAVTGRVDPQRILRKDALRVGDALWLTKPIGTGVLTTAHKRGDLSPEDLASTIASMVTLNRGAARAAPRLSVTIDAIVDARSSGERSPRLCAVVSTPVPIGFVSHSASPTRNASLRRIRCGSTRPVTARPNFGSRSMTV